MDKQPELSKRIEIAGYLVEALSGAVPFVGGAITATAIPAMQMRHNRRTKLWLDMLAEAVEGLQLDMAALSTDEEFIDTLIAATNAATNTSHKEKLRALRNAVLTSADITSRPEDELSVRFIRLIDEMSPAHLRLMAYFEDPKKWFDRMGTRYLPSVSTHRSLAMIAMGWEDLQNERLGLLIEDLVSWRVLGVLNPANGTTSGLLGSRHLTSLGQAFMAHIRDLAEPSPEYL